jgi:hypothetical protein
VKDADAEPFIAAILSSYRVRIPEMSFGEILGTRKPELRMKLITICRRLLAVGHCIMPAHWVMDAHIKSFHDDPHNYEWRNVRVQADFIESEIQSGKFAHDEVLVEEQATELRRLQDEFEAFFQRSTRTAGSPTTFAAWLVQSQASGGSFWIGEPQTCSSNR